MSGDHEGGGATTVISACLAVLQIGGIAGAGLIGACLILKRSKRPQFAGAVGRADPDISSFTVRHRARAGPAVLQVFLR